jgi:AmmeMemoRadiSam system protein B
MLRRPAVANQFYPGSPAELEKMIASLLPEPTINKKPALAVMSPHAGYVYSGDLAAQTLGYVQIPETVIILGPNHHGRGALVAVSLCSWDMPNGIVPIDTSTAEQLISASVHIVADESAHLNEHSLEVQVPFLQALQPKLSLVPICVSHISYQVCTEVAQALSTLIGNSEKSLLILASTDMSHFESRSSASRKDNIALQRITSFDPEGLYRVVLKEQISMCGFIPVTIALLAAQNLGGRRAEIIGYSDSGVISGDTDRVVGYAGVVIS